MNQIDELKVIDVCMEIGTVAGCNSPYTAGLTRRIQKANKNIHDLTVGELLDLHREHTKYFNETYSG